MPTSRIALCSCALLTLSAAASAAFGQSDQGAQATRTQAAPSTQAVEADKQQASAHNGTKAGSQPANPWAYTDACIAHPDTKPEMRAELRSLRDGTRALLGEDVTPTQLIKAAEVALLEWLQIDDTVRLPPGVAADEPGPWADIDPRLREAWRRLIWNDLTPDYLTVYAAPVLLDWLSDRLSRGMAKHYMELQNLSLEADLYFSFAPGNEVKLEMPETLPKMISVRTWSQPQRHRAEAFVNSKFAWGVIAEQRADDWYMTEWTATKRVGPYPRRSGALRLTGAVQAPPFVPVACQLAGFSVPLIGGDLVTNATPALSTWRFMAKVGRPVTMIGGRIVYHGLAESTTGERCHRFVCTVPGEYLGYLYISATPDHPYMCQLDGARMAGMAGYVQGTGYGRITYHSFSTEPIDEARFAPPNVPVSANGE